MRNQYLKIFLFVLFNISLLGICRSLFQWQPLWGFVGFAFWLILLVVFPYGRFRKE
ncbi:hypothetical protein BPO_2272 [Bergeyella porcorum]|uniref:Uncharacterized protein n=1 Tax=Bergeyella porcorum TaxID=1735111 RepID=A0AAU0F5J1_9FLAO